MSKFILLVLILGGVTFWWHWNNTPDPVRRKQFLQQTLIGILVVVSLLLVVTGRMHWLGAVFAGLLATIRQALPYLIRYFPMLTQLYRSIGPRSRAQNTSTVSTRFLEMTLDHETGRLSGKVLDGKFKGTGLADLDRVQLEEIYNIYVDTDPDSARLLENYLIDRFGDDAYREHGGEGRNEVMTPGDMSVTEALQVLGLEGTPDSDEITKAYRKIMQRLHPDRGGNQYFAAKANQARELLLKNFA